MKDTVFVIGHKNPDTDSICSAIAYAEFKRKSGMAAVAKRLGTLNRETEFVLKYFGVEAPDYLYTVKTQISDISIDVAFPVTPDISIKTTWSIMKANGIKTIPVVDTDKVLLGVVTVSDITGEYMDAHENRTIASTETPLKSIVETLNAEILCGGQEDFDTTGSVIIAATDPNDINEYVKPGDIVITGNRSDSQLKSVEAGANCMIITCGIIPEPEILELARQKRCVLLLTPFDTFTTARLINLSIPAGAIMSSANIVKFNRHDYIDDIQEKMIKTRYRSYPVVDDHNKIKGFISRYHLISRNKKRVILVDHNEISQTVNGIEEAEILEIIDHHRLGDIQTIQPIFIQNEPLGSTSTIIANKYFEYGINPTKNIAGILCAAILSDTINFKSPTSTAKDQSTALKLAGISGIRDLGDFARQMFKEGASLKGKTPDEIFYQDFKEYVFAGRRIGMGQIFTIDQDSFGEIKRYMMDYMKNLCAMKNYHLLMLFVTDVLEEGSLVLCVGDEISLIEKTFGVSPIENSAYLPGIVSRKKQVIPMISASLESLD